MVVDVVIMAVAVAADVTKTLSISLVKLKGLVSIHEARPFCRSPSAKLDAISLSYDRWQPNRVTVQGAVECHLSREFPGD